MANEMLAQIRAEIEKWIKETDSCQFSKGERFGYNRVLGLLHTIELDTFAVEENRGNSLKSNTNSPKWKPSEEQMTALLNAEGIAREQWQNTVATLIAKLYEDLKKL